MAIPLASNFNVGVSLPIDTRMVVQNDSDLNNINNKYIGMVVFSNQSRSLFYLKDVNTWIPITTGSIGGGGGGSGYQSNIFYAGSGVYFSGLRVVFDKSAEVVFEGNAYINKINNQTSFGVYNYYKNNYSDFLVSLSGLPLGIRTGDIVNLFYKDSNQNLVFEPTVMACFNNVSGLGAENILPINHPFYENRALQKVKNSYTYGNQYKEDYNTYWFTGINSTQTLDLTNNIGRNRVFDLNFEINNYNENYNINLPHPNSGTISSDRLLFNISQILNNTDLNEEDFDLKLKNTSIQFYTFLHTGNNGYVNNLSSIYGNNIYFDNKIEFIFEDKEWKLRSTYPETPYDHSHEISEINQLFENLERIDYTDFIDKKYTQQAFYLSGFSSTGSMFYGNDIKTNSDGTVIIISATGVSQNSVFIYTGSQAEGWNLAQTLTASNNATVKGFGGSISTNYDASKIFISEILNNSYPRFRVYSRNEFDQWYVASYIGASIQSFVAPIVKNSFDGSLVFLGRPNDNISNINSGAVTVHKSNLSNPNAYTLQTVITDNTSYGFVNSGFGRAISTNLFGDVLFIGGDNNSGAGAVWIYTGVDSDWDFRQKITYPGDSLSKIGFGTTVSNNSDGNILFIGSPNFNNGTGIVSIYTGDIDNGWSFCQHISGDNLNAGKDSFGISLANNSDGSILFVGGDTDVSGLSTGAVWVYTGYNLDAWGLSHKIKQDNSRNFGKSISTDDDGTLLLASDNLNISSSGTGIVYAYANLENIYPEKLDFYQRPSVNGVPIALLNESIIGSIPDIVYTTGNQTINGVKTFSTRPQVNGTGVLLQGEAAGSVSDVVYTTGNQTISGVKIFSTGNGAYLKSEAIYTNNPSALKLSDNPSNTAQLPLNTLYLNSVSPFETAQSNVNTTGIKIYWNFTNDNQKELSRHIRTQNVTFQTGFNPSFGPWITVAENVQNSTGIIIPGNTSISPRPLFINYSLEDRLKHIETNGVFSLLSGEKMGIGIHNPSEKLHVVGNFKLEGQLQSTKRPFINGTGVLLQGEAAGSSNGIINTTYSALTGLKAITGLTPGQLYRISDFHLKWYNQSYNDTGVKSGLAPEPLIVLALSGNKISHEAKSEIYPEDTVYYDIDASGSYSWGTLNNDKAIPDFKGWIYRRIDYKLNIDIGWDWRNITVNCCQPIVTGIPIWTGNVNYSQFSVVRGTGIASMGLFGLFGGTTGKLYYSIANSNSGNSFSDTNWWAPVSEFIEGDTYFSTDEIVGFRAHNKTGVLVSLPANQSTRIQQPTFTSSLTSQGTFYLKDCNDIKIVNGYSNVILGEGFYANTIGDNFSQNTIGNYFVGNSITNDFNNNVIGNSFGINIIGHSFNFNIIGRNVSSNTIGNKFRSNTIQNFFSLNTIGNDIYRNTFGSMVSNNTIGNNFATNHIGSYFESNIIANVFTQNNIRNDFARNTIRNEFTKNTIGNLFSYNTIGNYFSNNTIGNSFYTNTVGNDFIDNIIGNNFNFNTIGNQFSSNTIGNSFRMNTSEDYLSIGNVTGASLIYNQYNTRIFKNSNQIVRLSYFDASDQLVVTDPTA